MSYDLQIFTAMDGQDPLECIRKIFDREESEDGPPTDFPDVYIDALKKVHANFEWSDGSDPEGELLRDEFGLLISASTSYIEISMAYWHSGKEAEQAMSFLSEVVDEIIRQDSTLCGYDPQEDRVFKSLSTQSAVDHMDRGNQILKQNISKGSSQKPWWKFW